MSRRPNLVGDILADLDAYAEALMWRDDQHNLTAEDWAAIIELKNHPAFRHFVDMEDYYDESPNDGGADDLYEHDYSEGQSEKDE